MATDTIKAESAPSKPDLTISIATVAWEAAFAAYKPIGDSWDKEYDAAEAMPFSPERDAAFEVFYKQSLPQYQRTRDEFMRVPAPTLEALAKKMEIADATDGEHHDLCVADAKRLAGSADAR